MECGDRQFASTFWCPEEGWFRGFEISSLHGEDIRPPLKRSPPADHKNQEDFAFNRAMCPALFRCQNSYSSWRSVIVSICAIGHYQTMVGSLKPHHIRDFLMSFSLSFLESLLRLGCINVLFLWADLTRSVLSADSIPTDDVLKEVFARAVSRQHSETFGMRPNKDKGTAPKNWTRVKIIIVFQALFFCKIKKIESCTK